jgi:hypothetical protein
MKNATPLAGIRLASRVRDQELPVIIGLIVLVFVTWGIYPLFLR